MATVQDAFDYMKKVFKKEEAKQQKKKVILNYQINGPEGGTWQMVLDNGELSIKEGTPDSPVTATVIYKDVDSFYKMVTGEIGGVKGYAKGLLKFNGSPRVLTTIGKLFPSKSKEDY